MQRTYTVLFLGAFLIGLATVGSQTAVAEGAKPGGWVLTKQVDKLTDDEAFNIMRRSNEGNASLGLHCGSGSYTAFVVVPKALQVDALTLAELRFDKREAIGATLQRFDEAFLVSFIGGSKTDTNLVFMTDNAQKAVAGDFSANETARTGAIIAKAIQSGSQMVYRLPLTKAGNGTEATFNLSGFAQAAVPMIKACPIQ